MACPSCSYVSIVFSPHPKFSPSSKWVMPYYLEIKLCEDLSTNFPAFVRFRKYVYYCPYCGAQLFVKDEDRDKYSVFKEYTEEDFPDIQNNDETKKS